MHFELYDYSTIESREHTAQNVIVETTCAADEEDRQIGLTPVDDLRRRVQKPEERHGHERRDRHHDQR